MEKVLQEPEFNKRNDLLVILGNAIDGTQWDGQDQNYLQARWDNITHLLIANEMQMAFTFGDRDLAANYNDGMNVIKYINSTTVEALTYFAPYSV